MAKKKCNRCGLVKILEEFHKLKLGRNGRNPVCKKCRSEIHRANAKNPRKPRHLATEAVCTICKKKKPASEFYRNKMKSNGLHANCKSCMKDNERKRHSCPKYRERVLKPQWKRSRQKPSAKAKRRKRDNARYHSDPEYRKKVNTYNSQRRAMKRKASGKFTLKEWNFAIKDAGNRCVYCKVEFTEEQKPVQDHYIPLSRGGIHNRTNIVASCYTCNARKYNELPLNYLFTGTSSP